MIRRGERTLKGPPGLRESSQGGYTWKEPCLWDQHQAPRRKPTYKPLGNGEVAQPDLVPSSKASGNSPWEDDPWAGLRGAEGSHPFPTACPYHPAPPTDLTEGTRRRTNITLPDQEGKVRSSCPFFQRLLLLKFNTWHTTKEKCLKHSVH